MTTSIFSYKNYPQIPWQELEGKRILLTGVSGMIGTAICEMVAGYNEEHAEAIRILGMSRNETSARKQLGRLFGKSWFEYRAADINVPVQEMGEVDYIIHGASNTHPKAYAADPVGTITTNVMGTRNLLEYGVTHGCERFVFLSSVEIYGENRGDVEAFAEDSLGYIDCNTMRAGYPEGKRVGESLCNAYRAQYGMDFVIPRLSRIYGPTMLETDSKALSQFIRKAVNGEDIILKSAGTQQYSYTYVEDCAAAILFLLLRGIAGEAYNVTGDDRVLTLKELAETLAECAGTRVVFEVPDAVEAAGYSKATKAVLDGGKLRELGFEMCVPMREGLFRTVEMLRRKH